MAGGWTPREIERLAGPRSFSRGLAYQHEGRVRVEAQGSDVVTATVRGSVPYRVELDSVTAEHARKRNLMALIDKKRWP